MSKTILEKRIEERATERFEKEFNNLVHAIYNHPVGRKLKVSIGDVDVPLANFGVNYGLLNEEGTENKRSTNTNLATVKKELIEKYKKEETDKILERLDNIGYLFRED